MTEAGFAVGGTAGGAIELLKNAADANTFVDEVGAAEVTLTGLFQANTWIHIIARFISSTNRTLLAVGEIAGHKMAAAPGSVTLKLRKTFDAFVAEYVAAAKGQNVGGQ